MELDESMIMPGREGKDCLGNGTHPEIECTCDECDYLMCCLEGHDERECLTCKEENCPRKNK